MPVGWLRVKIALISYEYPPDTALGGIGTYTQQAARILRQRGHQVEVFSASKSRSGVFDDDGIRVHRLIEPERRGFPFSIAPIFARRHADVGFDVAEAPEYYADGLGVARTSPNVALVVRLQTPSYILVRLTCSAHSRLDMARSFIASLRRRELPPWHPHHGLERAGALAADEVVAPCRSILDEVSRSWGLDPQRVSHVPCPYIPNAALLEIDPATHTNVVSFVGRLETRIGAQVLRRVRLASTGFTAVVEPRGLAQYQLGRIEARKREMPCVGHMNSVDGAGALNDLRPHTQRLQNAARAIAERAGAIVEARLFGAAGFDRLNQRDLQARAGEGEGQAGPDHAAANDRDIAALRRIAHAGCAHAIELRGHAFLAANPDLLE